MRVAECDSSRSSNELLVEAEQVVDASRRFVETMLGWPG